MLTSDMIQKMNAITGKNVPLNPSATPSRSDEVRSIAQKAQSAPTPTETSPADEIGAQAEGGLDQIKEGLSGGEDGSLLKEGEAGLKVASGAASIISSPLAPVIKPVGDVISWLGDKIGSTKAAQDFVTQHPDAANALQRIATDASNAANVAGTVAGGAEAVEGASIPDKTPELPEGPQGPPDGGTDPGAAALAAKVKGVASEWEKPTTVPKATFNKARAVLAKDPSIPQFLAEQKLSPFQHVENGNYSTTDTAESLRDTAGQMSTEALRPSLQMADYSTPKTAIADIMDEATKQAEKDPNITADDKEAIDALLAKKGEALSRANPDGMSLTNMHDGKITYAKNGGYSPVKSAADNNGATANRAIASAMQKMVEDKAPEGVPVKAFNEYLSKYYKGADYLDALHTKKAPISVTQNVLHKVAEVAGAVVGHGVGGGVLGGVGGYMIGGALEHAVENLVGPARHSFLSNLEITNPEAFTKVQEYLQKQGSGGGMLRLKAPEDGHGVIRLGPSTEPGPSVAPYAKKNTLPVPDPKTGRMMRTYNSSPQ